ncbi:hypothetical protein ACOSQ3_016682 [Xanthoceras sorbifolium]
MSNNPVLHARTKHIELDLYFVKDKVLQNKLLVNHVPSLDQTADIFSKPLSSPRFLYLRRKLNMTDSPLSLMGHIRSISDGISATISACVMNKPCHAISKKHSADAETSKSREPNVVHSMERSDHERWYVDQLLILLSFQCMNYILILLINVNSSSATSSSSSASVEFFFRRSRLLLSPQPPSSSAAAFQRQPNLVHIFLH